MPFYDHICEDCGAVTEVMRRVADRMDPPCHPCKRCGNSNYRFQTIYLNSYGGTDSSKSAYPLAIPRLKQTLMQNPDGSAVCDASGQPIIKYEDVVFTSKKQQDQYMDKHGLVRLTDGDDPSVTDSQRHDDEDPCPSNFAASMVDQAYFVEDLDDVHSNNVDM